MKSIEKKILKMCKGDGLKAKFIVCYINSGLGSNSSQIAEDGKDKYVKK